MECMKSGAFIFFLDSAKAINYEQMSEAADLKHLEQIYGSHLEQFHTVSLSSVRTFLDLYKKDLEPNGIVKKHQFAYSEIDIQRTTELTNRMFNFRAQVRKLLIPYFTDGESDDIEEEEDPFDTLVERYLEFIPQYLFQTKEKKRRIFTGPPLSI
ncbi:uncharacterized protein TNCV_2889141 [Trichonephila clavipes]|nr:uncharacterized protein TNCV_2889141 [Trichonephila clavipes]